MAEDVQLIISENVVVAQLGPGPVDVVQIVTAGPPGPVGPGGGEQGPQGPQGPAGPAGQDGQIIITEGNVVTGEGAPNDADGEPDGTLYIDEVAPNRAYLKESGVYVLKASLQGPQGPQGLQGPAGVAGTSGRSIYSTNGVPSGALGANGDVAIDYVNGDLYDKAAGTWVFRRSILGEPGPAGADGPPGADGEPGADGAAGADAYSVALSAGFEGTREEWLESLVGPQGPPGADGVSDVPGPPGEDGEDGAPGAPGADGASAYEIAVANGFVGDETAWLASLVGPAGADGADGADGEDGAPGAPGADGAPGAPGADGADGADAAIEREVPATITASRNLGDDDGGDLLVINPASAAVVLTVRKQATYAWSENWQIDLANISDGTHEVRVVAEDGAVTILTGEATGTFRAINPHGGTASLVRIAANTWVLSGNTAAVA